VFSESNSRTGYRTIFLAMVSCMRQFALEIGLTHFDAIVHPRHAKLYQRVFNAEPIGKEFRCEEVGGSLGQYIRLDIREPNQVHARMRDHFTKDAA
jgi:hypothetical protein